MKINFYKKGFTLVEMIIVVGIIVVLFSGIAITSYTFKDQMSFNSAINNIKNIADEAKNDSLSTLSYPDFDDKDNDGKSCPLPVDPTNCDRILPNGYIINYDASGETIKVSLYADVLNSVVNSLDTDKDVFIKSIELPDGIQLTAQAGTQIVETYDLPDNFSVLYTQTNAEFYILGATLKKENLQLYLTQTDSKGTVLREKYIYFQNLNNTAQITNERMLKPSV